MTEVKETGEVGEVIKVLENGRLTIKLMRQEACAKCKACSVGLEEKDMFLEAENRCEAKVGDSVQVFLEKSSFLKAVIIMYTIPLITFLLSTIVTYYILDSEVMALIAGFVVLSATYIGIRMNEERFNNGSYRPSAIKIVNL